MKSYREELWFETNSRRAYINITLKVEDALRKSGIREEVYFTRGRIIVRGKLVTRGKAKRADRGKR